MKEISGNAPKVKYRWPKFLLAAVVVGILLAILWVGLEVRQVRQERDFSAPLPAQK
jgi:hypothetical protein